MRRQRLTTDFHLGIVVLFGSITVVGITPFAVYRFAAGEYAVALFDLAVVLALGGVSAFAWMTGRTRGPALFAALAYSAAAVAVAYRAGATGLLWIYPTLVGNFLLVQRRLALLVSMVTVLCVAVGDTVLADAIQRTTFLATAAMVALFSFVFATRAERQQSRLRHMALLDPLTGASNRRGMEAELAAAMAASRRHGTPLSLLLIDIDHFKAVNDDFGHEAGDQVLVQLVAIVRHNTRGEDRFSRMGGEEFGLLLPGADAAAAGRVAEKLRQAVEREMGCHGRTITVSIGVAEYRPPEGASGWLARADAALYEAKRHGRNRVVVAEGPADADG